MSLPKGICRYRGGRLVDAYVSYFPSVLSILNLSQHIYHIQPKRKSSVPPSEKEKRDRSALTAVPAQIDEGGMHTLGVYRTLSSFPSLRYLQSGSELASFSLFSYAKAAVWPRYKRLRICTFATETWTLEHTWTWMR